MSDEVFKCGNCGHEAAVSENLDGLCFAWLGPTASKIGCPNCGSFTLQKADDDTFTRGDFLVVKTRLRRDLQRGR